MHSVNYTITWYAFDVAYPVRRGAVHRINWLIQLKYYIIIIFIYYHEICCKRSQIILN
jgi:hypothetical protein